MVSQLQKGKAYVGYEQAKQAKTLLEEAANSTDPQKKVQNAAGFMNYAKVAQGDDSVVRSEDMKVLAGGFGFTSVKDMLQKIGGRAQGTPFSPGEIKMMSQVIDTIIRVKKDTLRQQVSPLKKRAEANNYDLSESIDSQLLQEIESEPQSLSPADKLKQLEQRMNANQSRIEELRNRKGN
jgi:vacuolar-type H+-ATPase subunit I/STV1